MFPGYLALVLHAHLPYVYNTEKDAVLEERWLFEALTECYIPILEVLEKLNQDRIAFQLTISLSPTLITMLDNKQLQERYLGFLDNLIALAEKEVIRTESHSQFNILAKSYLTKFQKTKIIFDNKYCRDVISQFKSLMNSGSIELITCAGTHGYLPLILTEEAVRAQIGSAVDNYLSYFGRAPQGIWLPECGYYPGLDRILKEFNIQYFILDTHGATKNSSQGPVSIYQSGLSQEGIAFFGRDPESASQVWSSQTGYPGDFEYREYYRDIGWDLPWEYIKDYLLTGDFRHNTGIKYYRITGKTEHKEVYDQSLALAKADVHATHFVECRVRQVKHLAKFTSSPPIIVCPYDMELFGHWWYEGPNWLDSMLRKSFIEQNTYQLTSLGGYLNKYSSSSNNKLSLSSWGEEGYSKVWLNPKNDWIYKHLHKAEKRMIELANIFPNPSKLQERGLQQAGRELLLAQSSDWAFMMSNETTVNYAEQRFQDHINSFNIIYNQLKNNCLNEDELLTSEQRDAIFTNLNYTLWRNNEKTCPITQEITAKRKVLILSWEFPPKTVGGLARHVYGLSKALSKNGEEVHVLTAEYPGCPAREIVHGVIVHRLATIAQEDNNFFHWILQLNITMLNYAVVLNEHEGPFQLIHAHDWLVAYAAKVLKNRFGLPLVVTIHATEHGRNQGIHNPLQSKIHEVEKDLTQLANKVICCSKYMHEEITSGFNIPMDKVVSIPNGIEISSIQPRSNELVIRQQYCTADEKIILFIGRLVIEKGVHILLEALNLVQRQFANFKCLIAGRGPMDVPLREQTARLNLEDKVVFLGYIQDDIRNQLLAEADIAVFPSLYEPFGIVVLEAMAAGTAVVTSAIGGFDEIIKNKTNGLKVPAQDSRSLAAAILELFFDNELKTKLIMAAENEVRVNYDWNVIAKQTQIVYNNL